MLATISNQQSSARSSTPSDAIGNTTARPVAGNQALLRRLQAKLEISQPGDPAEQEADRVDEQVMRMPEPNPPASAGSGSAELVLQRKCDKCEEQDKEKVQRKGVNEPDQRPRVEALQTKLTISQPGDPAEQEADRVAEQVMRMTEPEASPYISQGSTGTAIHRACDCKPTCECTNDDKTVSRKAAAAELDREQADGRQTLIDEALRSPGQPLDPATRAFLEPRFGRDFAHVRVHADSTASHSAGAVNALAYTLGSDIVFRSGSYAPATTEGQRLLAHELTHVVQQSGPGEARKASPRGDSSLLRPSAAPLQVNGSGPPVLMRDPPPGPDQPAQPPAPAPQPAPAAKKKAVLGKDSKGRPYVLYENEIRVGGKRPWRNNNPGNFDKPEDHPNNIGTDERFLIFPDPATGMNVLIKNIKDHAASTVTGYLSGHAPKSENPTHKYICEVLCYYNTGSTFLPECKIPTATQKIGEDTTLNNVNETNFAMAMAREEGWCDVSEWKGLYNCQKADTPAEYKKLLNCP
jgi:hypothetical protein